MGRERCAACVAPPPKPPKAPQGGAELLVDCRIPKLARTAKDRVPRDERQA